MPEEDDNVLGTESDVTSEEASAESAATEDAPESTAPAAVAEPEQQWQGSIDDVSETQRRITATEKDGTTVSAPFNWPGKRAAENLAGLQYALENVEGHQILRNTNGDYHEALMKYFGQATINSKPAGMVNEEFFDKVSNKTYQYFMEQADSFLDKVSNAD